jgi:hypothetical protein
MPNEQQQAPQVKPKVCPECRQLCQPLIPQSNPLASEHYCPRCHKSYLMDEAEEARARLEREAARETKH